MATGTTTVYPPPYSLNPVRGLQELRYNQERWSRNLGMQKPCVGKRRAIVWSLLHLPIAVSSIWGPQHQN
ncbi:hypothetical protein Agabi119p4_3933 [Agaricus bisporus var. burnettii]|uniref:Uncharacterized protein n=1 Tax=Agaricus bisporus var. burnettii TaxID=192524 RepID=A0A8H7KI59_AGABI|nr:hypothetical protein Agabi119p4_3933 [Agaricus bisporus var. burnettii]